MERNALWGLIAISAVHLALFTIQVLDHGYVSAWLAGDLWGPQVWEVELSQSQAAFWQLLGSYVIPLLVLAALLLGLLRAEVPIPGFVGYSLFAWMLVCSAILEPSGFPLGLIPAGMLILAHRRRRARLAG